VNSLAGDIRIAAQQGIISGFDLAAVSERVKRLNKPTDVFELARAGSGGRTAFSSLEGHFHVDRGIIRTEVARLLAPSGEARMTGSVNLPAWSLDLVNELRVNGAGDLPPLVMKLNGPIYAPRSVFDIERLQRELLRRGRPR
jgi:hypothetical protein